MRLGFVTLRPAGCSTKYQEFLLRNDPIAMHQQVDEHLQHLAPERDRREV
jgi:hypothetical protein